MASPKRNRIKEHFRKLINDYVWSPGAHLPSERCLAKDLQVNRITLRRAIAELIEEGFLIRQGRRLILTGVRSNLSEIVHDTDSRFITVMATWLADRFEYDIIRGIEAEAKKHDMRVALSVSKGLPSASLEIIDTMSRQRTSGFIYIPILVKNRNAANLEILETIRATGIPSVVLDNHIVGSNLDTVVGDYHNGMYSVTQHLIDQGHTRIAFVVSYDCYAVERRISGFLKCLEDNGVHPDFCPILRYESFIHAEEAEDAVEKILGIEPKITAIAAVYDAAALKIARQLSIRRLKVPDDIALTGYDNTSRQSELEQFLTSVEQPLVEIGRQACEFLIDRINGFNGSPRFRVLPVQMVPGRSTANTLNLITA